MGTIPIDVIFLGLIAGFILYKLFTILGQKDDDGSYNPKTYVHNIIDISDKVSAAPEAIPTFSETEQKLSRGFETVVEKIRSIDPNFSLEKFLKGAKSAFEMVLTAFAENDRNTLEQLLNKETYELFTKEIDTRIKNGVKLNLTLVALPVVEIKNIELKKNKVSIDVFYQSQQITLLKNNEGKIVEGDVSQVDNVNDTWTFSKELNSKNNWHLVRVIPS